MSCQTGARRFPVVAQALGSWSRPEHFRAVFVPDHPLRTISQIVCNRAPLTIRYRWALGADRPSGQCPVVTCNPAPRGPIGGIVMQMRIIWGKILPGQWGAFEASSKKALEIR